MLPPEPLPRASLADEVAGELRRRVLAGEVAPGEKLPSGSVLAASFGVSMSVIREAMSRLKHDGLIRIVQGAGAFVEAQTRSPAFRMDVDRQQDRLAWVFELRLAVEIEAAGLAAMRCTPQHIAQLREALSDMEAAFQAGAPGTDADARFHQIVAQATGNPLFVEMYAFLASHIAAAIDMARLNSTLQGTWREAHDEHLQIFAALHAGDRLGAREAIQRHIRNAALRLGLEPGPATGT